MTKATIGDTFRKIRTGNAWKTMHPAKPIGGSREQRKAFARVFHKLNPSWAAA